MPVGIYKRTEQHKKNMSISIKRALARPEVKAKALGRECTSATRAKIGRANSIKRKGMRMSLETRRRMSAGQKKRWEKIKNDPEKLALISETFSRALKGKYVGEKGANWRGGISRETRNGALVAEWRNKVLTRDNYTCQICDVYGSDLHVDHIKPWAEYPDLRFEVNNGRALCIPCHYYVTFKRKMPKGSRWGMHRAKYGVKNLN